MGSINSSKRSNIEHDLTGSNINNVKQEKIRNNYS